MFKNIRTYRLMKIFITLLMGAAKKAEENGYSYIKKKQLCTCKE